MKRLSLFALTGLLPLAASAQTYSENFDDGNAASRWSFNSAIAGDKANDNAGNEANFAYNYGAIGVPSAPGSVGGSTVGMNLEADVIKADGTGTNNSAAFSVSPLGLSLTGDYDLSFQAWQQVIGPFPANGSGSTQVLLAGIGSSATQAQNVYGTFNAVGFGSATDSGTGTTFRAFNGNAATSNQATFPGGQVYNNAYYSGFQGSTPALQATNFPTYQTGTLKAGILSMAWRAWDIKKVGSTVTWSVDGLLMGTITNASLSGTDIFFGQYDTNASSSTVQASRQLNFGIIDNINVRPVPEPAPMAALALGALALLRRRKKA